MISAMENILQFYFHRTTLEEVDIREVEQLASQYPYLGCAQYFLAKKYLQTAHPDYTKQAAKTALYFNNPHWLHLLLEDQLFVKDDIEKKVITPDVLQQNTADHEMSVIPEEEESSFQSEVVPEEPVQVVLQLEEQIPPAETVAEEFVTVTAENGAEEVPAAAITAGMTSEAAPETPDEAGHAGEGLPKLSFDRTALNLDDIPADGSIPLEPLHTVDYFASQGIKLREIEGKDKLSIKLRSFTEWLKTMKRIHPEKLEQESEEQVQSKIQHIAEHSNEVNEVVTEAMAEVFARQGLHQKAIEVYQKLSLQNPDKRTYFAAKISKLNDH